MIVEQISPLNIYESKLSYHLPTATPKNRIKSTPSVLCHASEDNKTINKEMGEKE
jgi:hypothetical protein